MQPVSGYMLLAVSCLVNAITGACLGYLAELDPRVSGLAASSVRVALNLVCVLLLAPLTGRGWPRRLIGNGEAALWLWGLLGAITVATYFASIKRLGFGTASFLCATSGAFTAAFAPLVLGQKNSASTWTAILVSLGGVYCLRNTGATATAGDSLGWALGLGSGLAAGLAYLVVAHIGPRQHALTVMAYWSFVALAVHAVMIAATPQTFPHSLGPWLLLLGAGAAAAACQLLITLAYQRAPAAPLAALGYGAPLLSLFVDIACFGAHPTARQAFGAALIVVAGAGLPLSLVRDRRRGRAARAHQPMELGDRLRQGDAELPHVGVLDPAPGPAG